ncbi:MAG: cardiolipin synthase [Phycisphaerae bacterium]|nr:cardiolipin synthase [Phycisphaerae bacterium]
MIVYLFQHIETILGFFLAAFLLARVLREHERPSTSIAWFWVIVVVPYLGVPAYLLFGGRKLRHRAKRKKKLYAADPNHQDHPRQIRSETERILVWSGLPAAQEGNEVRLLPNGLYAYSTLLEMIQNAKESIHVMTFILGRDPVGREIIEHLCNKARSGIRVRLLLDALGSYRVRGRFLKPLLDAGGQVGIFMPMLPLHRKWSANLRNHRKITIVDGRTAMLGGMNLAGEYMGPAPDPTRWIDADFQVRGPAVDDLSEIFNQDWLFATGHRLDPIDYSLHPANQGSSNVRAQVVASGPDVQGDPFHDAVVSSLYDAKERIWVVTPYFVPDEGLFHALMLQSRLGYDVRIVLPARSNHPITDLARGRYLRQLQQSGVRVYFHPKCMIHAKLMVIDGDIAISGSANLDMRSFYLNYEVAMFVYSSSVVEQVAQWIDTLIRECRPAPASAPSYLHQWGEDLAWLASPLL